MYRRRYSQAEKLAYYKALAARRPGYYPKRISGYGDYKVEEAVTVSDPKQEKRRRRYKRYAKRGGEYVGSAVGSLFGPMGSTVGGYLGNAAGSLVSKIAGWGDYKVNVNTLMSADQVPEFQNLGPRATIVRHREFIQDIVAGGTTGPTPFDLSDFRIQPGDSQTFPWLSQVAQNYEQYRFHGLIFEFKTMSGNQSSTPQLGSVVMATQYNSLSQPFSNKQEMENYEFATSVVPSLSVIHPIECDPKQTQCNGIFNIQTDDVSVSPLTGGDLRLYDLGRFSVATIGCPTSGALLGELWVSYECCLYKPRLVPASGSNVDHWVFDTGISVTNSKYFGVTDDWILQPGSDEFTTLTDSQTIQFDPSFSGNVSIMYVITGTTGATGQDVIFDAGSGATALNLLNGDSTNQATMTYDPVSVAIHSLAFFTISSTASGTPATVTIRTASGVLPTSPNYGDLIITQFSSDLNN